MVKKLYLKHDKAHVSATVQRWLSKVPRNRKTGSAEYKDDWYSEQCFACQYYVHLDGDLRRDWGVCSHPQSPFDGKLMFEHDGCEYYSFAADEEF